MKPITIDTLEIQNVKRIKAVRIDCTGNALTVVGGKNGQGKTSVLDSIAFALGGERHRPTNLKREGSIADAEIKLTMSNGLIVERKGKNAALKITDPNGGKTGQQLLNEFVSVLAIDLPKFIHATTSEKAKILLSILGIGDELENLERQERALFDSRHAHGQLADRKKKFAEEMPCFDGMPEVPVSAVELIQQQQTILAQNGENQRKRQRLADLEREHEQASVIIADLEKKIEEARQKREAIAVDLVDARKSSEQLQDESTAAIEAKLEEIETINAKVRANLDKAKAQDDAEALTTEYNDMTGKIEVIRTRRMELLNGADLPLPGLTVEGGELLYNGNKWDCMSGSEQLRVGTAIAQRLNPACGFVLIDKAEQFDLDTLREFGAHLESLGLQAIATRVSTGDECSIIIEDGEALDGAGEPPAVQKPAFNAGQF
ncbi:hypothetical protein PDESU_03339 [Pontiella desulfatans]|uniref:Rad50/SbcC-type AAA domain-containing protein n=1 Tax=Pontiella desulfatans TaxID=2750659 RepID=A0A6C2U473_PONDE|nr:AAA family ATPase [Pontiella desulfatans]VGO14770.1 hypothetical protein PDESU_03339 [Pontiella desulfatans]